MSITVKGTGMSAVHDPFQGIALQPEWMKDSACAQIGDAEMFFSTNGPVAKEVIETCRRCPVRNACLTYALEHPELSGVWGGVSEEQRKKMRRAA